MKTYLSLLMLLMAICACCGHSSSDTPPPPPTFPPTTITADDLAPDPWNLASPTARIWRTEAPLILQGHGDECVAYSAVQVLKAHPHPTAAPDPEQLYMKALGVTTLDAAHQYQGTKVETVLEVLKKQGVITGYFKFNNVDQLASYVQNNGPVIFGAHWWVNWAFVADDGWMVPKGDLDGGGYHAALIVGVDMERKAFLVMEHNGLSWGKDGMAWLHYSELTPDQFALGEIQGVIKKWAQPTTPNLSLPQLNASKLSTINSRNSFACLMKPLTRARKRKRITTVRLRRIE